jgi:Peptidase M50B-like
MTTTQATAPLDRKRLALTFWGAVAASLLLHFFQPYGRYLLYPFAFLSTWAHELGHGVTGLMIGCEFDHLELYKTLGGVAFTGYPSGGMWWRRPLVSAGGLLGPAVVGGGVIVLGSRPKVAPLVVGAIAGALWISLALWVRNVFGMAAVGLIGAGFTVLAVYGHEVLRLFVCQLTGIQLCLGSLSDFDYMFTKNFQRDGATMNSDTQNIAEHLFLPYWVWGTLIAGASLTILLLAFYTAWVKPFRNGAGGGGGGRKPGTTSLDDLDLDGL